MFLPEPFQLVYSTDDLVLKLSTPLTRAVADHNTLAPYVCCGYMDLHDDLNSGATSDKPYFYLRPVYWHESAVLVVSGVDNLFHAIRREQYEGCSPIKYEQSDVEFLPSGAIKFNAAKPHGLIPESLVDEVLNLPSNDSTSAALDLLQEFLVEARLPVKMAWVWYDDNDRLITR